MKRKLFALKIVLLSSIVTQSISCGYGSTPSAIVKKFYKSLTQNNFDKTRRYLDSETNRLLKNPAMTFYGVSNILIFCSADGIKNRGYRIEILDEEIQSNNAEVKYRIRYKKEVPGEASSFEGTMVLLKEEGVWKIKPTRQW